MLTPLQANMKEWFGKGKQDIVFHSIITSNDLQILCGHVIVVSDSLLDFRGPFVSMRVHE